MRSHVSAVSCSIKDRGVWVSYPTVLYWIKIADWWVGGSKNGPKNWISFMNDPYPYIKT